MPDEPQGKQRWREIPPPPDDERWTLDHARPGADRSRLPPLPSLPESGNPPPPELEGENLRSSRRSAAEAARGRDTFRPPDELLTEALRRQRVAAQPKPVGTNTMLAAVLAIGAIGLIVALTMYLAKQN